LVASAGLLGAGEPGATPPLVASVVFLSVVVHGGTAVLPRRAGSHSQLHRYTLSMGSLSVRELTRYTRLRPNSPCIL
jgi:hypothetical protein